MVPSTTALDSFYIHTCNVVDGITNASILVGGLSRISLSLLLAPKVLYVQLQRMLLL